MIHGLTPMRCAVDRCPFIGLWQLCNNHCPRHRRDYLNSIDPAGMENPDATP